MSAKIVICGVLTGLCLAASSPVRAGDAEHPLEPHDLSSPRATLSGFLSFVDEAYAYARQEKRSLRSVAQRAAKTEQLLQFLDLQEVAPSLHTSAGREAVVCLKEVLDRIELPPVTDIPDAAVIAARPGGLPHWTLPHTEIVLARISDGPREGQYVFSAETVVRAREFYRRVQHLPCKPGATEGAYEAYVSSPGWMIPLRWVRALPGWMRARHGGQAVWQWAGLVLTLLVAVPLMLMLYRLDVRLSRNRGGARYCLAPAFLVLAAGVPWLAKRLIADQIFITGRAFAVAEFGLDLLTMGALIVVVLGAANRVSAMVMLAHWVRLHGVDPDLVRLIVRLCGVATAMIVFLEGGRYWGLSLTTLITGASVSGLAVALAAQDMLKNVFGSLMIMIDKPFREGDRIRAKGYEGVVEDIGLRSTRIRLDSGHVVSISNEEMARLDAENISRRLYLRRSETIRLRGDTSPERIHRAAVIVRELLDAHEGMVPALPPQVAIAALDGASAGIRMTYWFHPPDPVPFAAFNEQTDLRLLERFKAEGIQLA